MCPSFGWSTKGIFQKIQYWTSIDPALSIGPFQKVQRELIYFPYLVRKNEKPPKIIQRLQHKQ